MHVKKDAVSAGLTVFAYIFVSLFALVCLLPFMMMISASFSSEVALSTKGIGVFPKDISFEAYKIAFLNPRFLLGSYIVTIALTATGTVFGLFIISMTGYALYRRDFFLRSKIAFFFYFTTLFSAGLAPSYIWMTKYLKLQGNYLAVLLPLMISPWLIILMRSFMKSIPFEITESGKVDGAGDFRIFVSLIFPMVKPALATVGLFLALGYWNEWYNSMLYLNKLDYQPLQYYLYKIVNQANALKDSLAGANIVMTNIPTNTLKMATAVLTTGPIIMLYPFVQRYFISGIVVGSVKG